MKKQFIITLSTLVILLALFNQNAFAQASDNCNAGAGTWRLVIDAAPVAGTTVGSTYPEAGEIKPCGADNAIAIDQSVWYNFVATSTSHTVKFDQDAAPNCWFLHTAVYKGTCAAKTQISCYSANLDLQEHHLNGLTIGSTYLIQVTFNAGGPCGAGKGFTIQVITDANNGSDDCTCATNSVIVNPGTCFIADLNGAIGCLGPAGCEAGNNAVTDYTIIPSTTSIDVSIDNVLGSFTGNVEVRLYYGGCSATLQGSACGPLPFTANFAGLTIGRKYDIMISTSANSSGSCTDFGICVGDGGSCAASCAPIPPVAGDAYGIYAVDGSATVASSYISAIGGNACGISVSCLVCTPTDDAYSSVNVNTYPIITAENISCLNTDIDFTTTDPSPVWPAGALGINATIADPPDVATVNNNQYSATLGRRDIGFNGDVVYPSQTFPASPNTAVPDNGCGGTSGAVSTIPVAGYLGNIATAGITVTINIAHTYDGDLDIFLTASNGAILALSTDNGGAGDNYTNTVFSDAAGTAITAGVAPFTGTYRPEGGLGSCGKVTTVNTFVAIAGGSLNPNGNWTLSVYDDVGLDVGTLLNWSITFPSYTATNQNVNYIGFTNMMMAAPSSGTLIGVATGCNGTYNYTGSVAGTPGFTYLWTVTNPGGCGTCSNFIATNTASSTGITFTNTDPINPQTFIVNLAVTSGCCGLLTPVPTPINVVVNPTPANPAATASPASVCIGGSSTLNVTGPIAGYNYGWYSVLTGGAPLGTGTSYTVNPVLAGVTTYYIEAVNSYGCAAAARIAVTVTGTDTPPVVPGESTCGAGDVTLSVTGPLPGYTYNWYSGSCGGTLLQTGVSPSYTTFIAATTTFYVSAVPPGCAASSCVAPVATYNAPPATIFWLGAVAGLNNWFNAANWTGSCLPTCASNVSIPDLAIDPDIGFNAAGAAACKDMNLQNVAILSFSDSKAELEICGNFTHSGTLTTNNLGKITFKGSTAQTYTKTGSGNFYVLGINNSSATGVTLAQNTNVTESLILSDGELILNSNTLTILNSSTTAISGGSSASYIVSETNLATNPSILQWNIGATTGAHVFPFGITSGDYIPVTFNNSGDVGNVSISTRVSGINNTPLTTGVANMLASGASSDALNMVVDRWWDISSSIASPTPAVTLSFTYTGSENTMTTPTNEIGIQHWNGTVWDNGNNGGIGTVVATGTAGSTVAGPHTVTGSSTFTYFSPYILVGKLNPLPIELISFEVKCDVNKIISTWQTASEQNNDYFNLEESFDGKEFSIINQIPSKGNSNVTQSYSATDYTPFYGTNYYRLKQTDLDGHYTYSNIVSINCNSINYNEDILPISPTNQNVDALLKGIPGNKYQIKLTNILGQVIVNKEITLNDFQQSIRMSETNLAKGVYYLIMITNSKNISKPVIIK